MWFQMVDKRPIEAWKPEDVAAMRPKVCELIARGQPGSIFCKTHNALMTVHGHPTINLGVTSGAIYVVRNPLDVAASSADFMGTGLDQTIELMGTDCLEMPHDLERNNVSILAGSWSQHVASWTGGASERLHVVRYEDMLGKPSVTFGGVAVSGTETVAPAVVASHPELVLWGPAGSGEGWRIQGEVGAPAAVLPARKGRGMAGRTERGPGPADLCGSWGTDETLRVSAGRHEEAGPSYSDQNALTIPRADCLLCIYRQAISASWNWREN